MAEPVRPSAALPGEQEQPAVDSLGVVLAELAELRALLEAKVLEDEQRQAWVARLTAELEEHRQDFIFTYVTGRVFRDLIQLYDTVDATVRATVDGTASVEAVGARLGSVRDQVLRTLGRQDVEMVHVRVGEPFDEVEQEAIDVRAVSRVEDDGTVVEVARPGFRYRGRLLRPASVIVGRYQE
jgi:molecular chaperone GrpE